MENKKPSQTITIKSPMYRAELDVKTGILTVVRDDENGTMPYDVAKDYIKEQSELGEKLTNGFLDGWQGIIANTNKPNSL